MSRICAKKDRERPELFGGYELPGWLGVEEDVTDHLLLGNFARSGGLRDLLLDKGRQHVTRADGIDGDPEFCRFESHRFGEAKHAVFGRNIGGLER